MPLGFEAPGSTICSASRKRFGPDVSPGRPNHVKRPIVDVNCDRLARFGVDADQGDDGAKVDQAIDPDAERFHGISMGWWGREKGAAHLARRPGDARWSERRISTMRFAAEAEPARPVVVSPAASYRDQIRMRPG